jgi:hypothetical protein
MESPIDKNDVAVPEKGADKNNALDITTGTPSKAANRLDGLDISIGTPVKDKTKMSNVATGVPEKINAVSNLGKPTDKEKTGYATGTVTGKSMGKSDEKKNISNLKAGNTAINAVSKVPCTVPCNKTQVTLFCKISINAFIFSQWLRWNKRSRNHNLHFTVCSLAFCCAFNK